MTLIKAEPTPRKGGHPDRRWLPDWPAGTSWTTLPTTPKTDLFTTLAVRRSMIGEAVFEKALATTLWHATRLRHRGSDGRFGNWESRISPSAGGLHGIELLCLPIERDCVAGFYDRERHALLAPDSLTLARNLNRESVALLAAAEAGTTVQLLADERRYAACYDNSGSLILRDAGALCVIISLVATALGLTSVILGRLGQNVVSAAGLAHRFRGVGAVHLGTAVNGL